MRYVEKILLIILVALLSYSICTQAGNIDLEGYRNG